MSENSRGARDSRAGRAGAKTTPRRVGVADILEQFLDGAPIGTKQVLANLAIPESLTDEVAYRLYGLTPIDGVDPRSFLFALHQSGLIQPRNSEWSLDATARELLLQSGPLTAEFSATVHAAMLEEAYTAKPEAAGSSTPNYLYTAAGRAFHLAGMGDLSGALEAYAEAATAPFSGAQWLAWKLADEQERAGILPADQSELLFLKAITLYREGQRREAKPLFERVVTKNTRSLATAMALNILGNMLSTSNPERAESLLRAGIEMSALVGNEHGVAIGEHNLGQLIGRDRRRFAEAYKLLQSSITLGDRAGNEHHSLVVRHSLGDLIRKAGSAAMREEAESQLRHTIAGLFMLDDRAGAGAAMHTLALLLSKIPQRGEEAESLYRKSIDIAAQTHDDFGLGIRLMSLARYLYNRRRDAADLEQVLRSARGLALARSNRADLNAIDAMLSGIRRIDAGDQV